MIRAGLQRLSIAFGLIVFVTTAGSLVIALATGHGIQRSVSLGYLLVGSLVMLIGLGAGMRGFGRPSEPGHSGPGAERVASASILIGIGAALLLVGVGLDPRSDIV